MKWKCIRLLLLLPTLTAAQTPAQIDVLNKPFVAQQWTIYNATLPDGTVTQRAQRVDISRASDGSTRFDSRILSGSAPQWQATGSAFADIRNIPSHLIIHLDPPASTARIALIKKRQNPLAVQIAPQGAIPSGPPQALGSQQIAGVAATGTRLRYLLPKGTANANEDVSETIDIWYSPDLQVNLATTVSDSLGNVTSMLLSQIETVEPDPSLFSAPPAYTITSNAALAAQ